MVLLIFICLFGISTTSVATTNKGPILQNWELKLVEDIFGQCNNDIDCPKGLICEKNACTKPENTKLIQTMDCMDKISSKKCKKLKKKGKCEDKKIYKKCMLTCQRCSPVMCDPVTTCSGHGTCTENGSCKCSDGFYGDSCSIACNAAQNCSNQGICGTNGACDCDCGFYMEDCSNYCHLQSKCNGHGTCKNDGSCQCDVGFYGDSCSTTTPITEAEAECLSFGNSTYINDTCFYVEMGLFNYTDAMVNCQNQFGPKNTGKLFEPKDSSTNDQVIEFAKNLILPSTEYLHIGFNDIATEGTWQYATGGDLVYTNWGGINPNNGASGNGEDCGETYSGTTWNDGICSHEQPSICEMISTGDSCPEYGIDYPYHDINTIDDVYLWTECAKHCHDSKGCQYWSWRMDQYRCYLKTSKNNRERAGNAISGAYDCLSECKNGPLSSKCTELESIEYHYDKTVSSVIDVVAGKTTKDNLNHPESGSITTTISQNSQESLAQSYSYERSKGNEIGVSLGVSVTANWGPGILSGGSASITAGFSSTWTTSEGWSRSNRKEITQENGFQISFTDTCPGYMYCVSQIIMEFGEAQIPYTMTASSKDNSEKCVEEGILNVQNAWNTKSIVTTTSIDPGNCQDSIEYASKCPGWAEACSDTRCAAFMLTNCRKTCGYCGSVELLPVIPLHNSTIQPPKSCPLTTTTNSVPRILVSTGSPLSSGTKTEIINTDNSGLTCKDLEEYPLQIYRAVGFNMGSLPVICGGHDGSTYLNQCHRMESGIWKPFANLTQGRGYAAGISYAQSSIVFGGFNSGRLRSTEIITEQGVSAGPDMPEAVYGHAIASVNKTTSILTGGRSTSSSYSAKTWFFSHVSQQFQPGPNLITGRYHHASATIQDKVTMENIVAVVGGYNGNYLDTTELLINGESAWQQGPQKPKTLAVHSAVEIGGDLYTIGGSSNDGSGAQTAIHRMSCSSRVCTWTTMTQELKVARQYLVAIPIPKSFCIPV